MPSFTFAYSRFQIPPSDPFPNGQIAFRPILTAHLKVSGNPAPFRCAVWPDSGADHCVFPLSYAKLLGLDPLRMKMTLTGGVGSNANATYFEEIEIEIPITPSAASAPLDFIRFSAYAGFTAGLETQGIGLLGQAGFFEAFPVRFDHKQRTFTIWTSAD